ncbi:MAG TPA: VOC family protein [Gaiellaceae bacterium]|nr:VOC family protein [Gaiellaceae bacterium]
MSDLVELALFTDDVAAVSAFYRSLVGSAPIAEWPGGALFVAGNAKILVHERVAETTGGPPNEDHFALAVPDADRACRTLRAEGYELLLEPRDYEWGRSAYLRDPDGRLVELAEG